MSEGNGSKTEDRSTEQLRSEIERTREELGDTVEALAHKADVKARAKERIDEVKGSVGDKAKGAASSARHATPSGVAHGAGAAAAKGKEHPLPLAVAGAFAAGILVGWLLTRGD